MELIDAMLPAGISLNWDQSSVVQLNAKRAELSLDGIWRFIPAIEGATEPPKAVTQARWPDKPYTSRQIEVPQPPGYYHPDYRTDFPMGVIPIGITVGRATARRANGPIPSGHK